MIIRTILNLKLRLRIINKINTIIHMKSECVSKKLEEDINRIYASLGINCPKYNGLQSVHIPGKHVDQSWKKKNKNSRL